MGNGMLNIKLMKTERLWRLYFIFKG